MDYFSYYSCACSGQSSIEFYCCCDQIFFCIECVKDHRSHYVLGKDIDLLKPVFFESFISPDASSLFGGDAQNLKSSEEITGVKGEVLNYHESNEKCLEPPPALVKASLSKLIPQTVPAVAYYLSLTDSSSILYSLDLHTYEELPLSINLEKPISMPFILKKANFLYILGGNTAFSNNEIIYKIDLLLQSIAQVGTIPADQLNSCGCLIHDNYIFLIGGRTYQAPTKEVMVFDTNSNELIRDYSMLNHERYSVSAVVHNERLYVFSVNKPDSVEWMQLNEEKKHFFQMKFECTVDRACGFVSVSDMIYMMNSKQLLVLDQNLECKERYDFERVIDPNKRDSWNRINAPMHVDDKLFFFGVKYYIVVPILNIESSEQKELKNLN